jgi:hypothetical protein
VLALTILYWQGYGIQDPELFPPPGSRTCSSCLRNHSCLWGVSANSFSFLQVCPPFQRRVFLASELTVLLEICATGCTFPRLSTPFIQAMVAPRKPIFPTKSSRQQPGFLVTVGHRCVSCSCLKSIPPNRSPSDSRLPLTNGALKSVRLWSVWKTSHPTSVPFPQQLLIKAGSSTTPAGDSCSPV